MSKSPRDGIAINQWSPVITGTKEFFLMITPRKPGPFSRQLDCLFDQYYTALAALKLEPFSGITATIFVSDAANQDGPIREHKAFRRLVDAGVAITIIQQPPAGVQLSMLAYHVARPLPSNRQHLAVAGVKSTGMGLSVRSGPYEFVYLKNLVAENGGDATLQTEQLMGVPGAGAQTGGVKLDEVVRTWLYVNDVDTHYRGVSTGRNRVFDRYGISAATGFPASTGIEGRSSDHSDLVELDVLAIRGLRPGQSRRMEALTHMNSTLEYGVTFERGRQVVFGDRRHLYVSGTASISNKGEVMFSGDVARQTERAIENVAALLEQSGARLTDLRYAVVYLRNASDAALIEKVLQTSPLKDTPRVVVRAPVCRPKWLVEIEGVAIDNNGEPGYAPF